jgi:hypothetical protein
MTVKAKLHGLNLLRKHDSHMAVEEAAVKGGWWDITRKILPPSIDEKMNHLVLTDGTFIKCIIVGVPKFDVSGYARTIDPGLIGALLNTAQDRCFIGYSFAIMPFDQADSNRALEDAEFRNLQDQLNEKDTNSLGHVKNKTMFIAADIKDDQHDIHKQTKRQFYTSCIITIRADSLQELDIAYSHVTRILQNNLVGYVPAEGKMLETYKSAQPWGDIADDTIVDCTSPQVAALLPMKRLDSRTDISGIWFGNQKMQNTEDRGKPILVDLDSLSAGHGIIFGPTGSGKTVLEVVLGMRAHDQEDYRVIYLTVKSDAGTQFRSVPGFYKDRGVVIDLGIGKDKSAINPLQIIFDEKMIDGSDEEYLRIFHKHKMTVASFFDAFLKTGLTDNQSHYLDMTLNTIYAKYGIISLSADRITCHPDKWNDGANFPTIHLLRKIWKDEMVSSGLGRMYESAESLYNRTGNLSNTGAYAYINRQTNADLSKDFIVFDLSGLDKGMQDAMSALVTAVIGARFNTDAERKTLLIIDEGVAFARNPERLNFVSDAYMMGRSQQITAVISFTQPTDMTPELAAMLKTNSMWAYVLGKGMGKDSVEYVEKFFKLTKEDTIELTNSGIGEGLLILGNQTIPIDFKVTDQEMSVLKGTNNEPEKASTDDAFMLLNSVADLVLEQDLCLDEWIENQDPNMMKVLGYEPHLVQRVDANGKAKAWIKSEIVDKTIPNKPKIYNQTLDHYASVIMIAGHLLQNGFEDVTVNHFDDEDVRARLGDQEFSFEYERPGSHTEKQLETKRINLESTNSRCFFVCQKSYEKFVAKAVGEQNTYARGATLKAAIDAVLSEHGTTEKEDKQDE